MPPKDRRVTLKIDRRLWANMEQLIAAHPEWGIVSVPEFVRRAIDSEIRSRKETGPGRVITLRLSPNTDGKLRRTR